MSFVLTNIADYTDEVSQELISKAILTGNTVDLVDIQTGVKYKETLNIFENTIDLQAATCGFTPGSGTVAYKQRECQVWPLEHKDTLCFKDLEKKFLGKWMAAGAPQGDQLGDFLTQSYIDGVKEQIELNLWVGNQNTSPARYEIDGWIYVIENESTRTTVSYGSPDIMTGSFTSSNIISVINQMVMNRPENLLVHPDQVLFLSYANYMLYINALVTANLVHFDPKDGVNYSIMIPGTDVKLVATKGLTGTDYLVLTYAKNLVYVTDLENEYEKFKMMFSDFEDEFRVNIQLKIGAQVKFPELIVANF